MELGDRSAGGFAGEVVAACEAGDAWAGISEASPVEGTRRRIYGMGGTCRASLAQGCCRVRVEEAGPLRAVIRCEGALEAEAPMHHYAGYRPFRLVTRIHAFAGHAFVRVLHTVVVACDPRQTELQELAVRIPRTAPCACDRAAGAAAPSRAGRPWRRPGEPGQVCHRADIGGTM